MGRARGRFASYCSPSTASSKRDNRPFLEFFSRDIPDVQEPQLVPDFRMYNDSPRSDENKGLTELQMWAEALRLNALDLLEILGDQIPRFPNELHSTVAISPSLAARNAKEFMKFNASEHIGLKTSERDSVPKKLRSRIESLGVLVFKNSALKDFHARGMCVYSETLPIIVFRSEISERSILHSSSRTGSYCHQAEWN